MSIRHLLLVISALVIPYFAHIERYLILCSYNKQTVKPTSLFILTLFVSLLSGIAHAQQTFTNPLLPSGADPWCIYKNGYYYYTNTLGNRIDIWRTKSIAALATAERKTVWTPPASGPYSKEIWAPEIHFLQGKWYIYFAADSGNNVGHRLWVIENSSPDPLQGEWKVKGKLVTPEDKWSIDGSVFEYNRTQYLIWSGWQGDVNGQQNIYIAKMKNPWTVDDKRTLVSAPMYSWEKNGDLHNPNDVAHVNVNEGPEVLQHNGRLFLIYSAAAGRIPTLWACYPLPAPTCWILPRGINSRSRYSGSHRKIKCMRPGIIVFSPHPTERKTGSSITQTMSRDRGAGVSVRRGPTGLNGRPTARPTSAHRCR